MSHIRILIAFALTLCAYACDDSISERAARDEAVAVADDDPAMLVAFDRAKRSLPGFLTTSENVPAGCTDFAVKVKLADADNVEFFWVAPFTHEGASFSGELANDGVLLTDRKVGERITFTESDVVDWMYRDSAGAMVGNFTACALLTHEDPEDAAQFKKQHGLVCPDS